MLAFLADPSKEVVTAGAKAGLTIIESSVLGAITIVAVGVAIWAVWKASKTQDLRVSDLTTQNEKMEKLVSNLTITLSSLSNAINNLTASDKEGQQLLQNIKNSIDTVIRDAIGRLGYRNYSPPHGMQAVRKDVESSGSSGA